MRKTIIFGTLGALFGFAALAQASDRSRPEIAGGTQVTRAAANDSRGDKHEHDPRNELSRGRHDDTGDKRHEAREGRHENEAAEDRDHR